MNKANECTCPSGDGSLRWPCPKHPAVEQADVADKLTFINGRPAMCGCQVEYSDGGGEYSDVIYVTLCAKHSGSAILDLVATNRIALTPEYEGQWHADLYLDREIPLAKVEGATPAEAVLALMSAERIDPEQESVEQAGGDERAAFNAWLNEVTYEENTDRGVFKVQRHQTLSVEDERIAWRAWQARGALAQPSPVRSSLLINGYQLRAALDFIAPDGTAEQLESEACIEWRQQDADFLEAGLYAFCAEYPEEGGVLLDEEPTNSQPSPAQELAERGTQHRFSTTEQTCRHDFYGVWWNDSGVTKTGRECRHCGFFVADMTEAAAEQAEAERPVVVARLYRSNDLTMTPFAEVQKPLPLPASDGTLTVDALMTVAQHERIVEARWNRAMDLMGEHVARISEKLKAERDAALARVAELELKLDKSDYAYDNDRIHMRGLAARAIARAKVFDDGSDGADAESARSVVAILRELLAVGPAQAQHSVPEGYALIPVRETEAMHDAVMALLYKGVARTDTQKLLDAYIAAAPGKEVGHE
ncbi:TPA: hypothetical protein SL480_001298 [Pseudomonas aeruginosa]|nr:hypothetical protein [Pseudomonas aeruginosa]